MKSGAFAYERPSSIEQALAAKAKWGSGARFLAGGQSLLPAINMRFNNSECLIDLNAIQALREIRLEGDALVIGALARHADVASSPLVQKHAPLLVKAARHLAHVAIRNRGTFGGSVALADPAAEWPAACLLLDARIRARGSAGERVIPAARFFQGLYTTDLSEDELLVQVEIPVQSESERCCVLELARRQGDYATAAVMARASGGGPQLQALRFVFFGVADAPLMLAPLNEAAEKAANQARAGEIPDLVKAALGHVSLRADLYTSIEGKRHLCGILAQRAVQQLMNP